MVFRSLTTDASKLLALELGGGLEDVCRASFDGKELDLRAVTQYQCSTN